MLGFVTRTSKGRAVEVPSSGCLCLVHDLEDRVTSMIKPFPERRDMLPCNFVICLSSATIASIEHFILALGCCQPNQAFTGCGDSLLSLQPHGLTSHQPALHSHTVLPIRCAGLGGVSEASARSCAGSKTVANL